MKRVLLVFTILFVAVVSTACINNLAVQDLNNKAQTYMEQGDYKQAIERLKSSLDLDNNIFETHYNLATAYAQIEDYTNAIEQYSKSIEIQPQNPVSYYSLATTLSNAITDLKSGKIKINPEDNTFYKPEENAGNDLNQDDNKKDLTPIEKNLIIDLEQKAITNYEKYLELSPKATDKKEVEKQIQMLKSGNSEQE